MSPNGNTINAGQSATFTVSVTPREGFNKVVMLTCSGLPTRASCNMAPSTVSLDGTHASTANVVVITTQRSSLFVSPRLRIKQRINPWATSALLVACILFCVTWFSSRGVQHRAPRLLLPASAILLAVLCSSCGGGYVSPVNPGRAPPGGTPAGIYPIVVTGTSGNVSHAATTQLTVN